MDETADHIKAVMIATFIRRGRPGRLMRAFDELPQSVQSALLEHLTLAAGERAVIGYVDDDRRCLLTTERIAWGAAGPSGELRLAHIASARMDVDAMLRRGKRKDEVDELSGVWNTLNFMIAKLKRDRR